MNVRDFQALYREYIAQCDELGIAECGRYDIHGFLAACVENPKLITEVQRGIDS